jgi:hypothetical protein
VVCGTALVFLCPPPPASALLLAKNIRKTIELLKYKIFQEEE